MEPNTAVLRINTLTVSDLSHLYGDDKSELSLTNLRKNYDMLPLHERKYNNKAKWGCEGEELLSLKKQSVCKKPLYYMKLIHTYSPGGHFGELAL